MPDPAVEHTGSGAAQAQWAALDDEAVAAPPIVPPVFKVNPSLRRRLRAEAADPSSPLTPEQRRDILSAVEADEAMEKSYRAAVAARHAARQAKAKELNRSEMQQKRIVLENSKARLSRAVQYTNIRRADQSDRASERAKREQAAATRAQAVIVEAENAALAASVSTNAILESGASKRSAALAERSKRAAGAPSHDHRARRDALEAAEASQREEAAEETYRRLQVAASAREDRLRSAAAAAATRVTGKSDVPDPFAPPPPPATAIDKLAGPHHPPSYADLEARETIRGARAEAAIVRRQAEVAEICGAHNRHLREVATRAAAADGDMHHRAMRAAEDTASRIKIADEERARARADMKARMTARAEELARAQDRRNRRDQELEVATQRAAAERSAQHALRYAHALGTGEVFAVGDSAKLKEYVNAPVAKGRPTGPLAGSTLPPRHPPKSPRSRGTSPAPAAGTRNVLEAPESAVVSRLPDLPSLPPVVLRGRTVKAT